MACDDDRGTGKQHTRRVKKKKTKKKEVNEMDRQ